jgi:hypothetical protein
MLAVERDANSNAGIVLYSLPWLIFVIFVRSALVCFSLNNKTATTSWDKALED